MDNTKNIGWFFQNYLFNSYRKEAVRLVRESDSWSKNRINEYQFNQLKTLINYAYNHVPFYNNSFSKAGFKPEKFKSGEDLQQIPVLTKNDIRTYNEQLKSDVFPSKYLIRDTSGGTTGLPVPFYADIRSYSPVEWVYMNSLWQRAGYSFYDRYVVFRGEVIKTSEENSQFWRYDKLRNCLIFSAFEMNEEKIPLYLSKIKKFKPKFLHSYPSVLYILASYIEKNNITDFPPLHAIFLGSETLYPWQRELFTRVFNTRLYSWYGHRERCILAGEQYRPAVYEVFPTYGYTELINENGCPCTEDGEPGELIGTSFTNYAFPLIRYNTHDIAENCLEKTSFREFMRIKNIKGRIQDFFIDKTGSMITFSTSYKALIPIMDKINAHQFIQNEPGKLNLNIEAKTALTAADIQTVKRSFQERFPLFDLNINTVNNIPRTANGKFRYFVQNISIEFQKKIYQH